MAGTLSGFNPDTFRLNIRNAMIMGLPDNTALQPTFYFSPGTPTYPGGTIMDSSGKPIDTRIQPTYTSPSPVLVPCAVEFAPDSSDSEGLLGTFKQTKVILTVLDEDYISIQDAIEVTVNQQRYIISDSMSYGLGTVIVYQLFCFRKDTT